MKCVHVDSFNLSPKEGFPGTICTMQWGVSKQQLLNVECRLIYADSVRNCMVPQKNAELDLVLG